MHQLTKARMYSLKPILVDQKIDLPTCMYKLKTVNNVEGAGMEESINSSVCRNLFYNSDVNNTKSSF